MAQACLPDETRIDRSFIVRLLHTNSFGFNSGNQVGKGTIATPWLFQIQSIRPSLSPLKWIAALSSTRISPARKKPSVSALIIALEKENESFFSSCMSKQTAGDSGSIPQKPVIEYVFRKSLLTMNSGISPVITLRLPCRQYTSDPFNNFSSPNFRRLGSTCCTKSTYLK